MSAVAAFLQRREEEKLAEKPVIGHKIHPITNKNLKTLPTTSTLNVKIKAYIGYKSTLNLYDVFRFPC